MKFFKSINIGDDIAIDPGTDFTSIYISGRGVVLREPSVISYNTITREIVAIGEEAEKIEGKNPENIATFHPIQGGIVTDTDLAGKMLAGFLAKVRGTIVVKPRIMVTIPSGISDVEERAIIKSVMKAGARQVIVAEAPSAAALGAGCDITLARGLMVIDIGGGKIDIAAISVCNCVVKKTVNFAGDKFTCGIIELIRKKHGLIIGQSTGKKVKEALCSQDSSPDTSIEVSGIDAMTHLPRRVRVTSIDTADIFDGYIMSIANLIRETLDSIPPEILGDILEDGILMVGGGAKLAGLISKLSSLCGIKIFPAEDIDLCTIKGAGIALENLSSLPDIAQSYHNL